MPSLVESAKKSVEELGTKLVMPITEETFEVEIGPSGLRALSQN